VPDHDRSDIPFRRSTAGRAGPGGFRLSPLDAADAVFRALTTGPRPLALNPGRLAPGLPDRPVPLCELRALLLHPATSGTARNKVWAELVRRARSGDPEWLVGLTGVAMPGLRRASVTLARSFAGDAEDLQVEVLTGFLAALRGLDLDDLDRVPLASRLCWAAWRAGRAFAYADAVYVSRRRDLDESSDGPAMPWGHPDFVLAAAVRRRILTAAQAELIGRSRLEGVPLAQIARELQVSHQALCHRRRRAEARLVRAIGDGLLADPEFLERPASKRGLEPDFGQCRGSRPGGVAGAQGRTPPNR
jgi:hypothetical protein